MAGTIHIIGAGLAGLAAAVRLAGRNRALAVHEATAHPGGRCRSYFDRTVGMTIDNGNHLVLSGNRAVLDYAEAIGSASGLVGPTTADFPFFDLATGERWTLKISDGLVPWWIFDKSRRVPGTRLGDYLKLAPLLWVSGDRPLGRGIESSGMLYKRLLQPVLLAALNIEPPEGSAALAATVLRETIARGGQACRPLVARSGLSDVLIEPALTYLKARGVEMRLEHELRAIKFSGARASVLDFGTDSIELGDRDSVVLAVPPHAASALVPDLTAPQEYRAIVNAHFRAPPPPNAPPVTGVVNGTVEWLFAFPDRLSVTISNGDRLVDAPRPVLAQTIWQDICKVLGIAGDMPAWQIVRERRATFAATPAENAKRPGARTAWENLVLAGDWTATGLPATLESATRSGFRAADLVVGSAA